MRKTYTLNLWQYSHYLCHHTHSIDKITPTLFMTSHLSYAWHRLHYTRHHILTFWPQNTILRTSHLLYYKSCPLYLCHHTNSIDSITATICMISLPVYGRQSIHYIFDIVPTMFDNTTLGVITPHSAYVWHHLCYSRCHIHSIRRSDNLYDFTSTSGMTSHTLYLSTHQLYLCYHNVSKDITPTFYDIIPTICVTSYALYITSYPIFMSSHTST